MCSLIKRSGLFLSKGVQDEVEKMDEIYKTLRFLVDVPFWECKCCCRFIRYKENSYDYTSGQGIGID